MEPPRNYQRYAISYALSEMYQNERDLFQKLVDYIIDSLEDDYSYPPDYFPRDEEDESDSQRKSREEMVDQWLKELSWWQARDQVKTYTLTTLFRTIWAAQFRSLPLAPADVRPSSALKQPKPLKGSQTEPILYNNQPCLGPIEPLELLLSALPNIRKQQGSRYGALLDSRGDSVSDMRSYLRKPVWEVCKKPSITRQEYVVLHLDSNLNRKTNVVHSLINIGGDLDCHRCAIYLHIIWHPDSDDDYILYIGQSCDLAKRLQDHNNPLYRIKHPSLHYFVWDSRPDHHSVFVVLAYLDDLKPVANTERNEIVLKNEHQLILNIAELWGALIFQTLPERELCKYMDPAIIVGRQHLNVANPLWQGAGAGASDLEDKFADLSKKARFEMLLHQADNTTRLYYRSLRAEFFSLKHSPNPVLKAYYDARREPTLQGQANCNARFLARTLEDIMQGREKKVTVNSSKFTQVVTFGNFNFRLSKRKYPELASPQTIFAQGFLHHGGVGECYSMDAQESDAARRFSLKITGEHQSQPYTYFIRAGGDITAQNINVLVDLLDGATKTEILGRARRISPHGLWDSSRESQ